MRILLIHNRFGAGARGGAERVVERLAAEFVARGHDVHIATPELHERHAALHRIRAWNVAPFSKLNRTPAVLRALWHGIDLVNPIAAWSLARTLKRVQPDIVHTHNLVGCGGLTSWIIRRAGILYIHTLHDVQLITPSGLLMRGVPANRIERSFLGRWFRSLRRRLMGSPTMVTSPSQWLLDAHRAEGFFSKSEMRVVGNPIDLTQKRGQTLSRTGSDPFSAVRKFLYVGQIEGAKGILTLVEAYRRLRELFPDVTLHVVGDGSLMPALKRASREVRGIILRGRLDPDGVRSAIAESDVVILPSLCAENQPSVILEAYAMGVPVIASRVGGIPEIVRDGETGFLTESGSVEDLLRALRICVEEPPRIRVMAATCRDVAAAHATGRIADQYLVIYTQSRGAPARPVSTDMTPYDARTQSLGSIREG